MPIRMTFEQPDLRDALAAAGLRRYEDFMETQRGEIVVHAGSSHSRRIQLNGPSRPIGLFLKVYRRGGRRFFLRRDKAAVEAENYRFLRAAGVEVPDVVCFGSRRGLMRLQDAFILMREVPDAVGLDAFVARVWPNPAGESNHALRRQLLERSAALVRRMHDAGFYHIDLQWRNILVSRRDDALPRLFIIDSSRGGHRRGRIFREHGRLRDLSSLAKEAVIRLTRTERLRWLKGYLGVPRLTRAHTDLIRTIEMDRILKDNTVSA